MKTYSELIKHETFAERLDYLRIKEYEYEIPRSESYKFYHSHTWQSTRKRIITRDMGFDLGVFGVYVYDIIIVHHINPITLEQLQRLDDSLLDPENLITMSLGTHNEIHYRAQEDPFEERRPGDTLLY